MNLPTPNLYPLRRLKVAATIRPSGVDKHTLDGELSVELCNYVDVYRNERISRRIEFMKASATAAEIERFSLCPGDVVITKDSETPDDIASAALVEESAAGVICAYHLAIIRPDPNVITGNFLFWSLRCAEVLSQFSVRAQGVTRFGLTTGSMGNVLIPVAPVSLQPIISGFLERETAKIDALVAEQERLIELLKEKRQAVISEAVTKGLNQNVETKDSGVVWLGEVPEHWCIRKLRQLARLESGHTPSRQRPDYWIEDECVIPWFTLADVGYLRVERNTRIASTSQKISQVGLENSAARLLPSNTVILSRTASVGFSGIINFPLAVSQDFAAWICKPELDPTYLLFCLRAMKPEFKRLMMGSTHQTIYMPDIEAFRVPCPPLAEQVAIAEFIQTTTDEIDTLSTEAERGIELLRERRSALISTAVTGKIDVRGLAPAIQEAA